MCASTAFVGEMGLLTNVVGLQQPCGMPHNYMCDMTHLYVSHDVFTFAAYYIPEAPHLLFIPILHDTLI